MTGQRQRTLLDLLLPRANEFVSTDRIVEELTAGGLSGAGLNALQATVSRLRRLLEPGGPNGSDPG